MDELRRMQELVSADWRDREPPRQRHIGDLAWGWHTEGEARRVRLWDGAWAWLDDSAAEIQLHPDLFGSDLHHEVVEAVDGRTLMALETDVATLAVLEAHGYRSVDPTSPFVYLARALDDLPEPSVPEGYRLRHLEEGDLERRVDVHRSAFHPSKLTAEKYRNLMQAFPYRADLDWVVEAPDGSFAAYTLCWLDQENGVAELEPVGTHSEHRRKGLARAAGLAALRRARELGARFGIVYARRDEAYPAPKRLYESFGFRPQARLLELRKA
jgi:ribosomal protein S18 acetylase RimI-like enzyme